MAIYQRAVFLIPAVLVALLLGVIAIGWSVGKPESAVRFLQGTVYAGIGQATIKGDDGWSYSVGSDVRWSDASGTWHMGDAPACLPPVGQTARVKFAATEVRVSGRRWRPVVWISCQT